MEENSEHHRTIDAWGVETVEAVPTRGSLTRTTATAATVIPGVAAAVVADAAEASVGADPTGQITKRCARR